MDPVTPSKWKGVRVENTDEPTDIAVPQAPWDGAALADGGDDEEPETDDAPSVNNPTSHFAAQKPPTRAPKQQIPLDDAYLEPGTVLGEYRIEAPIGEGGMGVVYSAVHPLIGKRAAVKVLKAELCRSAFNVERFVDEARVVNQIGHPNIVDVFAFGQTADGRSYFVMEWLKGETLRARAARGRIDLDAICEIIRPLARALEAAHEQGIIHRDLKPDNIFLIDVRGDAPLVKLLDFGIAKLAREEHRMERTATGAMVGTPQYIAPEQAKGYAIDARVDIYALGGILFELLTGRPPFVADNAMEMVAKHLMEPVPRPSTLADVPPELDELVIRMLSKDPAGRPLLAEVAATIERTNAVDRTSVKAIPAGPNARLRSEPINVPTPTPQSSPNLRQMPRSASAPAGAGASIPPASGAASRAASGSPATPRSQSSQVTINDLTETVVRRPKAATASPLSRRAIALLVAGFSVVMVLTYLVVSKLGSSKVEPSVAGAPEHGTSSDPLNAAAAGQDGSAKAGAQNETDGAAKDGAAKDGAAKDGAAKDGAAAKLAAQKDAAAAKLAAQKEAAAQDAAAKLAAQKEATAKDAAAKEAAAAKLAAQKEAAAKDAAAKDAAAKDAAAKDAAAAKLAAKEAAAKEAAAAKLAAQKDAAAKDGKTAKQGPSSPPKKRPGRLELTIVGGRGAPKILIDGVASGPAKELSAGSHRIEVSSPGMKTVSTTVIIREGATLPRHIALEAEKPKVDSKNDLLTPGTVDKKDK